MAANSEDSRHPQKLLEHLHDHVMLTSAEGKILYSNATSSQNLGYGIEEYIGLTPQQVVHPDDLARFQAFGAQIVATPDATGTIEVRNRHKDGHYVWAEFTATNKLDDPDLAAIVATSHDITKRKQFEAEVANLNRTLSVLSDTNQAIVRIRDQQALFEQICRIAVDKGGFQAAWIGLKRPDVESVRLAAQAGLAAAEQSVLEATLDQVDGTLYKVYSQLINGAHIINNDLQSDPYIHDRFAWMAFSARAIGAFPLMIDGVFRGVLMLNSAEPDFFTPSEVKLLDEMALDIAFTLEFREQEVARQQAEAEVKRYARRMEILHLIDRGIIAAESIEGLVQTVLSHLRRLIPADRCTIAVNESNPGHMTLFAADYRGETALRTGTQVPLSPDWEQRFDENGLFLVDDLLLLENPTLWHRRMLDEGLRSVFHVLLRNPTTIFGTLSISSITSGFFTDEYQTIAREIAMQLAIAIQQMNLNDALQRSEVQYRQIVEDQIDPICRYRPDFTITFVNQAYANLLGKRAEELVGSSLLNTLPDDQRSSVRAHLASISTNQPVVTAENPVITADGTVHWYQFHDRAILDSQGNVVEIQATGRDITERKLAEAAEHEQRLISESMRDSLAALSGSLDVDEVLRLILEYAATVVPSEGGSIILFEDGSERIAQVRGFPVEIAEKFQGYRFPPSSPKYQRLVNERQPVVLADTRAAPEWIAFPDTTWIRSTVAIPIEVHDQVIGVLNTDSAQPHRFRPVDVEHLQAFARYAALALTNAYEATQLEERVRQRTAELNDAKERVEAILNSSLDGILLAGADLRIQRTNPWFDTLFTCVGFACIGKPILDLIHPDDQQRVHDAVQLALNGGIGQQIEARVRRVDGTIFDGELGIGAIIADSRQVDGIVCTVRDISERKHNQDALAEERNLLRTLIDALPDLVWVKDNQHRFVMFNAARGPVLSHIDTNTVLGKTDSDLNPGALSDQFRAEEVEILRTGQPIIDAEVQLLEQDGTPLWISTTKVPIRNLSGEIIGIVGTSRNITERKQREQQLRFHASLQENVSDAVISTDASSKFIILSWNKAAERIYGWSAEEALGKSIIELIQIRIEGDEGNAQMRSTLFTTGRWQGEATQQRRDGSRIYILASVSLFRDENGAPLGIVAINHDITERKMTEQALKARLEQEREFQQYLKELHEIAIELTPIDQLDDFYRSVIELGRARLGFDRLALFLYDAERGTAIGTYGTDVNGNLSDERALTFQPASGGLMLRAFHREERFAFEGDVPLLTNYAITGHGWNAASILWDGNQSQGWLVADNGLLHKPASQAQLDILALYSLSVGTLLARKKTEAALRQSEANLQAVMNSTSVGILLIDRNATIQMANQLASEYAPGIYRQQFELGTTSLFDLALNDREGVQYLLDRTLAGEHMHVELTQQGASRPYVLDLHYDPVITASGDVIGATVSFVDVTERKRAEVALRVSEEKFRSLVEGAPEAIVITDQHGRITLVNAETEKVFGYPRDEMLGQAIEIIVPDSKQATHISKRGNYMGNPHERSRGSVTGIQGQRKNGEIFEADIQLSFIETEVGPLVMAFIADITERRQAEEAIRSSEARYRLLSDHITDLIARIDSKGIFQYASPSSQQMLGFSPEELLGMSGFAFIHPDDSAYVLEQLAAITPGGPVQTPVFRFRHKDGHYIWVEAGGSLIWSEDGGELLGFIVVARDVTERHAAQEALRQSEELLRSVLENLPVGVGLVSVDGRITLCNPAAQKIWAGTRYQSIESGGMTAWCPEVGLEIETNGAAYRAIHAGETTLDKPLEIEGFDGSPRYLIGSAIPIRDTHDQISGAIIVNQDVTVMKLAEKSLRESFQREKEIGDLKSRLVSMASHEFRTPLATILSSSEMLLNYRERMDDPKINRKLVTIANQVKHLTSIVEDVLDLTRMQTGKTDFKPVQADFDALCREILDEFRSRPEITQTITYECTQPPVLLIDKKLMRQVILNLVSNAIKYSPSGSRVTVTLDSNERHAVLHVSDQGIGIPDADLRHLFEPFHRAGNVGTISGTGLGLSITRQALEMHSGAIRVETKLNVGTTFTVTLPTADREREQPPSDEADMMR